MKHPIPLKYNKVYHIYNRGINGEDLFRETTNYEHFIRLFEEYLPPVADIYAWVLLKNHFHFLIRIKSEEEIGWIKPRTGSHKIDYQETKKYNPSQQFGNLFNAYTKAFNIRYNRTGKLFETPFRRIPIDHEKYFRNMVHYIHNNPVHHGFCESILEYPWSSYLDMISLKSGYLNHQTVIGWFNSKSEFIKFHQGKHDNEIIEPFIFER